MGKKSRIKKFKFKLDNFINELAIGIGAGLRYDFDFFVFRLDTGFKTYNPALPISSRWQKKFRLGDAVNKIKKSKIKKLVITDTIDNSNKIKKARNIEVLTISNLLGEAIKRISNSTSVSDLFK